MTRVSVTDENCAALPPVPTALATARRVRSGPAWQNGVERSLRFVVTTFESSP